MAGTTKDMTVGSPRPLILRFALPLLLGNLFQQLYNVVDSAIVGQSLGSASLAAVGSTTSVQFLILGFVQGFCLGLSIPVGQRYGAHDEEGLRRYVRGGLWFCWIFSAILTTLTLLLCSWTLTSMQVPSEIYSEAYQYLFIIFLEIPFAIFYNWMAASMRALGNSRDPFLFLAAASVLNVVLDLLFIQSFRWGVAGAAAATVLSQCFAMACCAVDIFRRFPLLVARRGESLPRERDMQTLLANSVPMGFMWSLIAVGSMIMQSANNALGTQYVAAFTIGTKIKQFSLAPFDALASAGSAYIAQNYGARRPDRIREGLKEATRMGVLYGLLAGLVLHLFGRTFCALFLHDGDSSILDLAYLYIRRLGYFMWVLGFMNVWRNAVQSMGHAGRAMGTGLIEMAARAFIALALVPAYGYEMITWTDQAAWITGALYIVLAGIRTLRQIEQEMASEYLPE